jgi:ribonuclease P/MRP protein subunit RPP1
MLCDLNIIYPVSDFNETITPSQLNDIKNTINVAEQLGYTHIAINFKPNTTTSNSNKNKLPNDLNLINPINLGQDFKEYENRIKIFTRITIKVDDPSQCQNISKFQQIFDIIAVEPITEKSFQSTISNLDVDIISFNLQERLPCYMKHKALGSAIEKGMFFEIKYTDFLNNKNRPQSISNAKQIIRASRNRGMIISSGCTIDKPYQLRNSNNVIPILKMLGIDSNRCNQMFKDWSLKVLLNGRLRIKSYKQTICINGENNLIDNNLESKNWDDSKNLKINNVKSNLSSYKKRKQETALDRILKKQKN